MKNLLQIQVILNTFVNGHGAGKSSLPPTPLPPGVITQEFPRPYTPTIYLTILGLITERKSFERTLKAGLLFTFSKNRDLKKKSGFIPLITPG